MINQKNTKLKTGSGVVMVALSSLVFAGCMHIPQTTEPEPTTDSVVEQPTDEITDASTPPADITVEDSAEAAMTDGEVTAIEVEAGSFYFKPAEIRVKKGEKVKITLNSVDMMHDFNIDELGVKLPIVKSGETGTVEFTADQVGEFEYYCSVGKHRQNGQVGKLIVEE